MKIKLSDLIKVIKQAQRDPPSYVRSEGDLERVGTRTWILGLPAPKLGTGLTGSVDL